MTTQRYLLTTRGKAAHSGLAPEEGISAILAMMHVLQGVLQLDRDGQRVSIEAVRGGMRPNVIAPECQAWIRVDAAGTGEIDAFHAALKSVQPVVPGASLDVEVASDAAPVLDGDRQQAGLPVSAMASEPRSASAHDTFQPVSGRIRLGSGRDPVVLQDAVLTSAWAGELGAYLASQEAEMLAVLMELARLETPSSQPETQRPAFDLLARELAKAGYNATWWPGRRAGGMLLAYPGTRPRHAPVQLLLGHCDTVWPVGTLEAMPVHVHDGRLSGPGVFDMKAGLVQTLFALRALAALGLRPPATPVLLGNSDEEIGSGESTRTIERLARIACRAFVMEPALGSAGKLKTARKGVGQFRLRLASDEATDNALGAEMVRLIRAIFDLNDLSRGITLNVGLVTAGATTGPMREAELVIDARVPDFESARRVEAAVYALEPGLPSVSLETSGRVTRLPLERTARNQALWRTAQRLGGELGLALEEGAVGGGSDGNTTSQYTATLDGLGAVGDGAHALHEHVVIDAMPRRAALLALLLLSPLAE